MLTEKAKEDIQKEKILKGIKLCEEMIAKAEKYERLKENKDWQGFIEDLHVLMGQHEQEIKYGATMIPDAPNSGYVRHDASGKEAYQSSKLDWMDFINRHEIERNTLQTWIKEPEYALNMAALARDKLPILKAQLKELDLAPATSGNGTE